MICVSISPANKFQAEVKRYERFGKQRSADFGCETERRALFKNQYVGKVRKHYGCKSLVLLVGAGVFVIRHNGFTVSFETDGGSAVENVKVMHSELIVQNAVPMKEGWVFTGWYSDPACTQKWDLEKDTVTGSMTLYAGWQKKE